MRGFGGMKPCIYKITFDGLNKCYIGQTCDLKVRFKSHCSLLQSGSHANFLMQDDFMRGAISNPKIEVLEECERPQLHSLERKYIMENIEICYNSFGGKVNSKRRQLPMTDIDTIYTELNAEERQLLRSKFGNLGKALKFLADNGTFCHKEA